MLVEITQLVTDCFILFAVGSVVLTIGGGVSSAIKWLFMKTKGSAK